MKERERERENKTRQAVRQMDGNPTPAPASSLPAQSSDKQPRRKSSIISSGHDEGEDAAAAGGICEAVLMRVDAAAGCLKLSRQEASRSNSCLFNLRKSFEMEHESLLRSYE